MPANDYVFSHRRISCGLKCCYVTFCASLVARGSYVRHLSGVVCMVSNCRLESPPVRMAQAAGDCRPASLRLRPKIRPPNAKMAMHAQEPPWKLFVVAIHVGHHATAHDERTSALIPAGSFPKQPMPSPRTMPSYLLATGPNDKRADLTGPFQSSGVSWYLLSRFLAALQYPLCTFTAGSRWV